ncbi:multidrug DMT transporter permease [Erwinia psidii]|uniref:DNA circularization protein n=1 Tax=Erwinia psidii TaxID=69224 RepID=UPI00226B54DF|nr:DNA circularization N-terminal domain-containing protein [Erwinia psidii]MCX8962132.1 multidrug DMT transporter permease [Erwinia psidii]
MSWEKYLLDASFRGVALDVLKTRDAVSRDVAQYEYLFVDGGDVEDLGRKPRNVTLTAVVWGDEYESQLQALIAALDTDGSGELIHPVFGSMPEMLCTQYAVDHDAETPDFASVEMSFLESATEVPFFTQQYPVSFADALFNQAQTVMDYAQALLENALSPFRTARRYVTKVQYLNNVATGMFDVLRGELSSFSASATNFVNMPAAFVSDLNTALTLTAEKALSTLASVGAAGVTASIVMAGWGENLQQQAGVAALPESLASGNVTSSFTMPDGISPTHIAELTIQTGVQVALRLAQDAADMLSDEDVTVVLSPDNIEIIAGDVRSQVQAVIDSLRTQYEEATQESSSAQTPVGVSWLPVVNALRDTAMQIQTLAAAVISQRPPLVRRQIMATTGIHLLAHLWYADATRASELLRLNPLLRNPNNLRKGDVVYAYAR